MAEHENSHDNKKIFDWQPPSLDLRVITLVLSCFAAGMITSSRLDVNILPTGNGKIIVSLFIAVVKYLMLVSLCLLSLKYKACTLILLLYDAVCAIVFGFFVKAFFVFNTALLSAFILPMLIYCYVMTAFTGDVTKPMPKHVHFTENAVVITKKDRFIRSGSCRTKIILLAILLEGIIAPFVRP